MLDYMMRLSFVGVLFSVPLGLLSVVLYPPALPYMVVFGGLWLVVEIGCLGIYILTVK